MTHRASGLPPHAALPRQEGTDSHHASAGAPGLDSGFVAGLASSPVVDILERVWSDAEARGFSGWDPYDGLNSRFFRTTPFFRLPAARQAWIQLIKRSPVNLRPFFGQRPEVLAKGLALFARGAWRLAEASGREGGWREGDGREGNGREGNGRERDVWRRRGSMLLTMLETLRSPGFNEICWGYPYDWQSRAFFQPRNSPNLICSVFGAMAFEERRDGGDARTVPADICRFITNHLKREEAGTIWITYTPTTNTQVHNVNMLGAALLAREAARTDDTALADLARAAMKFSVDRLRPDGSWPYGEARNQGWVDNFHTGYNLVALEDYRCATGETWMDAALSRAYSYWDRTFFRKDGAPAYYNTKFLPVDIHCSAQAILTYLRLARLDPGAGEKARRIAHWTLGNMWDGRSHFTFQKTGWYVNRVPQIRWGQAWMFHALAELATTRPEQDTWAR